MDHLSIDRRSFVKVAASGIAALSFPKFALAQATPTRMEWQQFKATSQYGSFLNALSLMKANTNAADPSSWRYWVNVHVNYCPHDISYFLAWHRGYLYHLERRMRLVCGNSALTIPYWDYYKYPGIPSEFTDAATGNPLYISRVGTNVYNALDLSPFGSTVWNFQRGKSNAFEPTIESAPHNPVHNLIGGFMAGMESPTDPIFFLHHANIDRLWYAWALPDGKGTPYTAKPYSSKTSDPYWAGSFTYASGLTLARYKTYYPQWLSIYYANVSKPTSLPPQALASPIIRVQAQIEQILRRPARGNYATAPSRVISASRRSLGSVKDVGLDESSVSAQMPVEPGDLKKLQDIVSASATSRLSVDGGYKSVKIVLDNIKLIGAGRDGGYFYNVYLNLPPSGDSTGSRKQYFLGTLGAFELAGAAHHGSATLEYLANDVIQHLNASELRELNVSLVRVSGQSSPKGPVVKVGEIRVEITTDEPDDHSESIRGPGPNAYTEGQ